MMTPLEFMNRYRNLEISFTVEGGFIHRHAVDVHVYLQTSRNAVLREKDALLNALNGELRRAGGLRMIEISPSHRQVIARAFYGKGSPEDCRITLEHAIRFGRTRPDRLQNYCDQTGPIGIDCSGFVNNYFLEKGTISAARNISQYALGRDRQNMIDIRPDDVIIWTNRFGHVKTHPEAHIGLVHSPPDRQGHATIVESAHSLHGLTRSTYTFSQVRPGVFRVLRPSGHSFVKVFAVR